MKRWGFFLLELAVVVLTSAAAVFGAFRLGAGLAEAHSTMPRRASAMGGLVPGLDPGPLAIERSSVGTFLGIRDELALDHIRKQPVTEARLNKGGSSISLRLTFGDGTRAAFKPTQTNPQTVPRKEVAAYRLNRLLGMNVVAPATMRSIHRDEILSKLPADSPTAAGRVATETIFDENGYTRGEVSLWIPVVVDSGLDKQEAVQQWTQWMTIGEEIPPEKVPVMAQLSSLLIFDMLQNNSDRFSGGNLLTSSDGKTLYYMDNTFGFQQEPEGHIKCRTYLMKSQKFSRRMVETVRRLDLASLREAIDAEKGVLSEEEMRGVMARRGAVLRYIDGLIAGYGADRVMVFP